MTMWFSISEHFRVILYSLIMGVVLGIVYDFVKISRVALGLSVYSNTAGRLNSVKLPFVKQKSHKVSEKNNGIVSDVIIFIGDILYSLVCACIYSVFLFHAIRGQMRWYFILSSAIGFFAYYFTISKFNLMVIETVFFIVKVAIIYLIKLILFPFHILYLLLLKVTKVVYSKLILPMIQNVEYRNAVRRTELAKQNLKNDIRII